MDMKKSTYLLIASIGALAFVSCAKDELVDPSVQPQGEAKTVVLAYDAVKTSLVGGKTRWAEGDEILIYSAGGASSQKVKVGAAQEGKDTVHFTINMDGDVLYAVYPADAAAGVSKGTVNFKIPSNPDGLFGSANIAVAKSEFADDLHFFKMKNATAVFEIDVQSNNAVEILQLAGQTNINGTYAAAFDAEGNIESVTAAGSNAKSSIVMAGGMDGKFYVPIAPGSYDGFSMTAMKGNGGYQTLTSGTTNVVEVNHLYNLGKIGDNLTTGLPGEGTEADPYRIANVGEFAAFTTTVNLGNSFEGKYLRLESEMDATTPIGYWNSTTEAFPFKGSFDGNDKEINLAIDGASAKGTTNVGLFGYVGSGATIKNLKLKGSVTTTGSDAGALVGYAYANEDHITVSNVTNSATVNGTKNVAGIIGYACGFNNTYFVNIDNCTNNAKIEASVNAAGISALSDYCNITGCVNNAEVKSTTDKLSPTYSLSYLRGLLTAITDNYSSVNDMYIGTGGVSGFCAHSTVEGCSNTAPVSGLTKVGGICGSCYWSTVKQAVNLGNITASGMHQVRCDSQMGEIWGSLEGGIVGHIWAGYNVEDSRNSGTITGCGGQGGIVGIISCVNNSYSTSKIVKCENTGDVIGVNSYHGGNSFAYTGCGGIVGSLRSYTTYIPSVIECKNSGKVSNDHASAGGIVATISRHGSTQGEANNMANVDRCVNTGDVEAPFYAGGIVGLVSSRRAACAYITNCQNDGKVTGLDRSPQTYGSYSGGIIGANAVLAGYGTTVPYVYNCINNADLVYPVSAKLNPRMGGIWGDMTGKGAVVNCFNRGKILPVEGSVSTEALQFLGSIVGIMVDETTKIEECYYVKGTAELAVGSTSKGVHENCISESDETGAFESEVEFKNKSYNNAVDILNAWVNSQSDPSAYYLWTAGPAFVK